MALLSSRPGRSKLVIPVVIIILVILVVVLDARRRSAESQLQQLTVKMGDQSNTEQNRAKAQEIVNKVRKLIDIPAVPEPTVATIVDVAQLQQKNPFYNKAKNGDYLIITATRAILYDPDRNVIIDVVPVQIEAPAAASSSSSVKPKPKVYKPPVSVSSASAGL